MRFLIVLAAILVISRTQAQSIIQNRWQPGLFGNGIMHSLPSRDSSLHSKWSFSKYAGLSMGYTFFKGGSVSSVSVPVGIQLNRQLSNHLYAFAGVAAAPSYLNFNSTFIPAVTNKTSGSFFTKGNNLALYSRAELGLMYVNDAKTFSIFGSIGVERSSLPAYYSAPVTARPNPVFLLNQ